MRYESKYYAFEDLEPKRTVSQCKLLSVWGSVLMLTVEIRVIDFGMRSEGKTSRNELTSRSVQSIYTVSSFLEVVREVTRKIH